ncbi:MutS-related protein [Nannocystis bainbridge]|uniref:DNA mismatch repair protein MutS n=1 Tax=Nannocystis bainbridge TaxID=2995303 RepID=A0ABT5DTY4_9BACT|nr:DNA mismatch repair protein MutS [Nannocystis bainbridge]MDC0716514.1 DNA mismatch repair protein MutS [Nannocystis bainbridge]
MSDPRSEYQRRLAARQAAVAVVDGQIRRISDWRLGVFLGFLVLLGFGLADRPAVLAAALAPLLGFVALVVVHEGAYRRRARAQLAVEHYLRALRRLDDAWRGEGVQHREFVPPEHPYAADLDLFGPGSLFALLCTARTRGGEATLARWLLQPAGVDEVLARQEAVLALRERLDLREDLALLGGDVRAAVAPEALVAWGTAPPRIDAARFGRLRLLAIALGLAAIVTAVLAFAGDLGFVPLLIVAVLEALVMRTLRPSTGAIVTAVEGPRRDLEVIAQLLARVEREPTTGSRRLTELAADLRTGTAATERTGAVTASTAIAGLARAVDWLEARKSGLFAPIAFLLMWELHGALTVERWRQTHGPAIARWLAALGQLEALASLATYAYERPGDPMPTVTGEGPRVEGEALRHPLLRASVPNSVTLGSPLRVLMVSGSNMSGKSTLMRTLGVNVVLALAGAPVSARSMTLSPLQIGATLRIEDSLQNASSRFYSELRRLLQLRDLARAGDPPLLFLLDEIFHGTNSHDRKIGAEAVLRALVEEGAIGLCTTHDLALAEAIADLGERARNVHFADEVVEGKLVFDYTMRPGLVGRSNAIALMRAIGLLPASEA